MTDLTAVAQATDTQSPQSESARIRDKAQKRSTGLKLFDAFLYPFFTNFVVFGISVVATYLTARGSMKDEQGNLVYGKTGEFFQKRGDWLVKKFEGLGLNHNSADMAKMVFFSFADGSLIAPFVKLFEDRREKIGRAIDRTIGKEAPDAVYAAEPKQGWLSVLGGRLATVSIVVPTAVLLDKLGLNDKLFKEPGLKVGKWIESKPSLAKFFGKLDIPEVTKVGFFEFFYTSVCTAGLYISSRFFARLGNKHAEHKAETKAGLAAGHHGDTLLPQLTNQPQPLVEIAKPANLLGSTQEQNRPTSPEIATGIFGQEAQTAKANAHSIHA
ncbi:hypothetical protein GC177_07025 [bacterium]|nr:hypothetical protein [bacterium]